jgi:hypothetical protein
VKKKRKIEHKHRYQVQTLHKIMNEEDAALHTDDSDDSNGTRSKMCLTLVDSDTEKPSDQPQTDGSDEEPKSTKKRSKKLRIDDSENDEEASAAPECGQPATGEEDMEEKEQRLSNLTDDSEEEKVSTQKKSKKLQIDDSENDQNDEEPAVEIGQPGSEEEDIGASSNKKKSRIVANSDSDSGETPMARDLSKYKSLIDEDSSSSDAVKGGSGRSKPQSPVARKKKLTKKKEKAKKPKTKSGPSEKDILRSVSLDQFSFFSLSKPNPFS